MLWQADRRDCAAEVMPSVDEVNDFVTNYARYDLVQSRPCVELWLKQQWFSLAVSLLVFRLYRRPAPHEVATTRRLRPWRKMYKIDENRQRSSLTFKQRLAVHVLAGFKTSVREDLHNRLIVAGAAC